MHRRMRPALGTFVEVVIDEPNVKEAAFNAAFAAIELVQNWFSFHQKDSLLNQLNRNAGKWLAVPAQFYYLCRLAHTLTLASQRRFDCSIGAIVVREGALPAPTKQSVQGQAATGSFLQFGRNKLRLIQPVWLVMDGIAKGFAVDLAIQALKSNGVQHGWVNAGGDMRAFGAARPTVQIRHRGQLVGHIQLYQAALATSAVEHLPSYPALLLTGGKPLSQGCFSVVANSAWRADALTKVAAACSPQQIDAELARFSAQRVPLQMINSDS